VKKLLPFLLSLPIYGATIISAFFTEPVPVYGDSLAWDANTETDFAGYNVYIEPAGATVPTVVATVTGTGWTIPDNLVPPGATVTFFVTALNTSNLESDFSNPVSYFVPNLATATTVTLNSWSRKPGQDMAFSIAWTANPGDQVVTTYNLVFERVDVTPPTIATQVVAGTTYAGTLPVGFYRWYVQAVNRNGTSAPTPYFY